MSAFALFGDSRLIVQIGLPPDPEKVIYLTSLDVFLTGNGLIVTP